MKVGSGILYERAGAMIESKGGSFRLVRERWYHKWVDRAVHKPDLTKAIRIAELSFPIYVDPATGEIEPGPSEVSQGIAL